jgi:hypothetical protein
MPRHAPVHNLLSWGPPWGEGAGGRSEGAASNGISGAQGSQAVHRSATEENHATRRHSWPAAASSGFKLNSS